MKIEHDTTMINLVETNLHSWHDIHTPKNVLSWDTHNKEFYISKVMFCRISPLVLPITAIFVEAKLGLHNVKHLGGGGIQNQLIGLFRIWSSAVFNKTVVSVTEFPFGKDR